MKINKLNEALIWIIGVVPVPVYLYLQPSLPEKVPTHYGISGEPDQFSSPINFLIMMMAVHVFVQGILMLAPYIDPKKEQYPKFKRFYFLLRVSMSLLMAIIPSVTFINAVGGQIDIIRWMIILVYILFILIANYMATLPPNWMVGIRTPWTLSNDHVWRKTHRIGGRMMFASASIGLILSFFLSHQQNAWLLFAVVFIGLFLPLIWSYFQYERLKKEEIQKQHSEQT